MVGNRPRKPPPRPVGEAPLSPSKCSPPARPEECVERRMRAEREAARDVRVGAVGSRRATVEIERQRRTDLPTTWRRRWRRWRWRRRWRIRRGPDRQVPVLDVARDGRAVVDDEEPPFSVRISAVEDGQVAPSARRGSGKREDVVVRRVVRRTVRSVHEPRRIGQRHACGIVEREIGVDRVEGSSGIGHDDRVLASGCDEEHVDAIRPPVRQVPEGDVDVGDRARAARDLAPRRVRVRGASSANDDESAARGSGPRSLGRGARSSDRPPPRALREGRDVAP